MLSRWIAFAGLLLLGGCAYDAGYHQSNYASQPNSVASYYSAVDDSDPYQLGSPVYGRPYVNGPVNGGIYVYGDDRDIYGGPVFSPYHGIQCDRRRYLCWGRNGPDYDWSYRFFGGRHAQWDNGGGHDGNWNHGDGNGGNGGQHGDWNNGGGHGPWNHGGNHGGNPGGNHGWPNPGVGNPKAWVYKVPLEPDGSGKPTFIPNGCGANGQPPC
jgi:hypothetical protein